MPARAIASLPFMPIVKLTARVDRVVVVVVTVVVVVCGVGFGSSQPKSVKARSAAVALPKRVVIEKL